MSNELMALIEACQKGDKKAWNQLIPKCQRIIMSYLTRRFSGHEEEIDEITQKVSIRLWRGGIQNFHGTSQFQFLAYLKKITINEANTHFKPRRHVEDPTEQDGVNDDPAFLIELKQRVERLQECMGCGPSCVGIRIFGIHA
jgi:DNA-directed RNA polymerase specialized sigma24 family protein